MLLRLSEKYYNYQMSIFQYVSEIWAGLSAEEQFSLKVIRKDSLLKAPPKLLLWITAQWDVQDLFYLKDMSNTRLSTSISFPNTHIHS